MRLNLLGLLLLPCLGIGGCDSAGELGDGGTESGPTPEPGEICFVLNDQTRANVCAPWICVADEQVAEDLVLTFAGDAYRAPEFDVLMYPGGLVDLGQSMSIGDTVEASEQAAAVSMKREGWPTDLPLLAPFADSAGRAGTYPQLTKVEEGFTFTTGDFGSTVLGYRPAECPAACLEEDEIGDPVCTCGCDYESDEAPYYELSGLVSIDWAGTP